MESYDSDSDLEFIANLPVKKKRKFQNRPRYSDNFEENEFRRRFRMSKECFRKLLIKIENKIEPKTLRWVWSDSWNIKFTVILISGVVQSTWRQSYHFCLQSESSMSIIVADVSTVVAELKNEFLFLPKNEDEIREAHQKFCKIG
jgi:hypothetical protein